MTAGRKPVKTEQQQMPQVLDQLVEQDLTAAAQLGKAIQSYGQGRDLVNQLLGQAQAFQAAGDLLRTFGVSKLAIVKESKLYQQLAGSTTPNGSELKGTWVEFCNLLGISDDKANQDIANLQAFGEEALENMQRVGIGYRDLRQFRKLPADQRVALIEAAKEGDKASLLELAEDLIAKHVKEKEESAKAIADTTAQLEEVKAAAAEINRRKDLRINALEEENAALTAKPKSQPTPELLGEERMRFIRDAQAKIVADIEAGLRSHFTLLEKLYPDGDVPNHARLTEQQAISQIIQAARCLAGDFGIILKLDDLEKTDLLWLTQGEQIFGKTGSFAADPSLLDDDAGSEGN